MKFWQSNPVGPVLLLPVKSVIAQTPAVVLVPRVCRVFQSKPGVRWTWHCFWGGREQSGKVFQKWTLFVQWDGKSTPVSFINLEEKLGFHQIPFKVLIKNEIAQLTAFHLYCANRQGPLSRIKFLSNGSKMSIDRLFPFWHWYPQLRSRVFGSRWFFCLNTCLAWISTFRRRQEWGKEQWAVVYGVVSGRHCTSDNESKCKYFCLWEIEARSRM